MEFSEYQTKASETAVYPDRGSNIYYPALGLVGEAGEIANKVKKIMRDSDGVLDEGIIETIVGELGDVLWYLSAICDELDVSLEDVADKNIEKLYGRKARGTIQGSGDTR